MKINRDILIKTILEYQPTFLKLLDFINSSSGTREIPESLYLSLYSEEICKEANRKDDSQAPRILSIESLVEGGIFLYHNKGTGMLFMEAVIYDLLKFIDISRSRELNRKDFELLRSNLENAVSKIIEHSPDTEDYEGSLQAFHTVMSETLSKIRANVERLTQKVDKVAHNYQNFEDGASISILELYEKVEELYLLYVLPCFEFISPNMQMRAKSTFSQSVDELINYHEKHEMVSMSNSLGYSKTAVTAYFKDVSNLEAKLRQYTDRLESNRNFFISIEDAFSTLMESVGELRHGKQKNFKLNRKSEVFSHFNSLDGLSTMRAKFNKNLNWEPLRTERRFREFLLWVESKVQAPEKVALKPIDLNDIEQINEARIIQISNIVNQLSFSQDIKDVHLYLHSHFLGNLDDFSLIDVLYGLESVYAIYDKSIVARNIERKQIKDDTYFMMYLPIQIKENANV